MKIKAFFLDGHNSGGSIYIDYSSIIKIPNVNYEIEEYEVIFQAVDRKSAIYKKFGTVKDSDKIQSIYSLI